MLRLVRISGQRCTQYASPPFYFSFGGSWRNTANCRNRTPMLQSPAHSVKAARIGSGTELPGCWGPRYRRRFTAAIQLGPETLRHRALQLGHWAFSWHQPLGLCRYVLNLIWLIIIFKSWIYKKNFSLFYWILSMTLGHIYHPFMGLEVGRNTVSKKWIQKPYKPVNEETRTKIQVFWFQILPPFYESHFLPYHDDFK